MRDPAKILLNRTEMACAVRSRIDKWDLMKLQSFCKAKDTVNKTKRPPTDCHWVKSNMVSNLRALTYLCNMGQSLKLLRHNYINQLNRVLKIDFNKNEEF